MTVFLLRNDMSRKIERAMTRVAPQTTTLVGKGERLWPAVEFLERFDPTLQELNRQRLTGDTVGNVIKTKDVMTLLAQEELDCNWGVLPMNKLVEWAYEEGYQNWAELRQDFDLVPLGGSECSVEIACDPQRQDLVDAFASNGIEGLTTILEESGERIATDTPGIAEYFFEDELLLKLSGSLEALPKVFAPVIIGVVESGNSLKEEDWLRLSDEYKEAVLLRSELMLVIKKSNPKGGKYAN